MNDTIWWNNFFFVFSFCVFTLNSHLCDDQSYSKWVFHDHLRHVRPLRNIFDLLRSRIGTVAVPAMCYCIANTARFLRHIRNFKLQMIVFLAQLWTKNQPQLNLFNVCIIYLAERPDDTVACTATTIYVYFTYCVCECGESTYAILLTWFDILLFALRLSCPLHLT